MDLPKVGSAWAVDGNFAVVSIVTLARKGHDPIVTYKDGSPFAKELALSEFMRKFTPADHR